MVILARERSSISYYKAHVVRIQRQVPFDVVVHQEGDGQLVHSLDLLRRAHRKEERAAAGSETNFKGSELTAVCQSAVRAGPILAAAT